MKNERKWSVLCCLILFITIFAQLNSNNEVALENTIMTNGNNNLIEFLDPDYINYSDISNPLFTLRGMTNDDSTRMASLYMIQDYLKDIGIALDVEIIDWPLFVYELIATRNFDLFIVGFIHGEYDPDFTGVYDENGTLNAFGYHTSMDWDEGLGTGINEWYMDQGTLIMPPDSSERVQHYWEWEQYLMDKILPVLPLPTPSNHKAIWNNLLGYNASNGLLQSWGKMSWDGSHTGQDSTSEIVIADNNWTDLNPLFNITDEPSALIESACLDPMVWLDSGCYYYPHLISDWTHINATHVRLSVRENIKWQNDPENIFINEYLDAEDVYFTFFAEKYLSDDTHSWDWLEDFEIIDDHTLDIFIDADVSTPENEPYNEYLKKLGACVLPEHYLNQTQIFDGVTPDITHESWAKFSSHCFGTGLFEIDAYEKSVETNLTIFDDCWWLDALITNDPALDWANRFGYFRGGLEDLRICNISNPYTRFSEFEAGKLDLVDVTSYPTERGNFETNSDFDVVSSKMASFPFMGYNMRESRGTPMQSMDPCPYKPEMTKGLAVRKAIAYAINRTEINEVVKDGKSTLNDYPIYEWMTKWLNPDIIKYDYNLTKAKEYMMYAGYETGLDSDGDGLTDITELEVTFTDRLNPDTDGDTLIDGDEVNVYHTNPLVADADLDSDSDGLTNVEEVDIYFTDPLIEDTDGDSLIDGDEVIIYFTNPTDEDTDDDGMPDGWEVDNSLDPLIDDADEDSDDDGLTNFEEYTATTDPNDEDTDGDGLLDGNEVHNYYTNPLISDADLDSDSDGLTNVEEVDLYLTDPLNEDSDDDGITDMEEVITGTDGYVTDPNDADTDSDGLTDLEEITYGTDGYLTNPTNSDTDGDGFDDAEEIANGTDPTDPEDPPTTDTPTPSETPSETPTETPTETSTPTTQNTSIGLLLISLGLSILGSISIVIRKRNKQ